MKRGIDGQIYSIHAPGLPSLLLPVYAVAGYLGVVAFLCLLAALTALAIFDLAHAVAGARAASLPVPAVGLTVPFVPHGWLIFPGDARRAHRRLGLCGGSGRARSA